MMTASLRPPSGPGSRSPSPGAGPNENGRPAQNGRASMGPSSRPMGTIGVPLASPRPGGARPASELLGSATQFQTPEAEAIDQWFENLQNYEATLEEMAAASLDVNFKEELSAIEQWFKVLSEAERTAALYSLLQHSTQVQIRFFITVLQQMARSDPMTALLSPAAGSMQAQMEAKLASMNLKSPGLKSGLPSSPIARTFTGAAANRQSMIDPPSSSFLSPDAANVVPSPAGNSDAAGVLAQQRAKLKANPSHRISAPALPLNPGDSRNVWGSSGTQLDQVNEHAPSSGAQEIVVPSATSRPKSTDFSGAAAMLSPMVGDSWATMVPTPNVAMFPNKPAVDSSASKLNDWSGARSGVPIMEDAKKFRRSSKTESGPDDGGLGGGQQQRNTSSSWRNNNGGNGNGNMLNAPGAWNNGAKSPALSNVSSNRYGGSDDGSMAGLGVGMGGFNAMGMPSPALAGMGMGGMAGMAGQINPFMLNAMAANMNAMGMTPEAQLLAAQMGAMNGFGLAGLQAQQLANQMNARGVGGGNNRMGGNRMGGPKLSPNNAGGKKDEEDVDPKLLDDIPGWLRSLRLHKYTPNFEGANWRDMVVMDEAALEAKGVAALGARRKMLKTFEIVRKKMGIEMPGESA